MQRKRVLKSVKRFLVVMLCICLVLSGCASEETGETGAILPSAASRTDTAEHPDDSSDSETSAQPLGFGDIQYGDGVAPLDAEQENAIHTYMTAAYESLARLEAPDFPPYLRTRPRLRRARVGLPFKLGCVL